MKDMKVTQWNESYARGENAIFYPHEEVVRFLNRFIRKRIDSHRFSDVIYRGDFYRSGIGITQGDKLIEAVGGGGIMQFILSKHLILAVVLGGRVC
ncbi:hypothetical protein [uncultured Helicobacter sp.]|uniref:hypothetical protein n=1 Tax=uncultured Helicobacter sp. TaxID=175537 RepID=UPI0026080089|nr:hypothetical protein [uncultured Helicobacter sp.]